MSSYIRRILKALMPVRVRDYISRRNDIRRQEQCKAEYDCSDLPLRTCHYNELFVRHDGWVYPCCLVWGNDRMKIGHINDRDLLSKIANYKEYCYCERYKLRCANSSEKRSYKLLDIELSLLCHGKCAMCCVDAPDWKGELKHYDRLTSLIKSLQPLEIRVQGGEVLIQEKSMEWLRQLRGRNQGLKFSLVTNANVSVGVAKLAQEFFDLVIVSFVGFQPATYQAIMGLDLSRTLAAVEVIAKSTVVKLVPKYLVTPLNLHECGIFLEWVISLKPYRIRLDDCGIAGYLRFETRDHFWNKIMERSEAAVKEVLIRRKDEMITNNTVVGFDTTMMTYFHIDEEFVRSNGLSEVCRHNIAGGAAILPEEGASFEYNNSEKLIAVTT